MKKLSLIIVFFVLLFSPLNAQNNADCVTALDICSKEDLVISQTLSNGSIQESLGNICAFNAFNLNTEFGAFWIRYSFISDGDFVFNIIPREEGVDIDFYVFTSDNNDCTNLNSVRCMVSGVNVGTGSSSEPCIGPTGLAFGSTDTEEGPGCQEGDDNFLAPLQVQSGEVYYLLINTFSASGMDDFTIEHDGSAQLFCDPVSTADIDAKSTNSINVLPNPFQDNISIHSLDGLSADNEIQILDLKGQEVHTESIVRNNEIDLSRLASGIYFLRYTNNRGEVEVYKIVKQ